MFIKNNFKKKRSLPKHLCKSRAQGARLIGHISAGQKNQPEEQILALRDLEIVEYVDQIGFSWFFPGGFLGGFLFFRRKKHEVAFSDAALWPAPSKSLKSLRQGQKAPVLSNRKSFGVSLSFINLKGFRQALTKRKKKEKTGPFHLQPSRLIPAGL